MGREGLWWLQQRQHHHHHWQLLVVVVAECLVFVGRLVWPSRQSLNPTTTTLFAVCDCCCSATTNTNRNSSNNNNIKGSFKCILQHQMHQGTISLQFFLVCRSVIVIFVVVFSNKKRSVIKQRLFGSLASFVQCFVVCCWSLVVFCFFLHFFPFFSVTSCKAKRILEI